MQQQQQTQARGLWIRIRILNEDKNDQQKIDKSKEFSCFEVLNVLF
jgi:hypothetical protein